MKFKPSKKVYSYRELFSEIISVTKGDFEYSHRAIRFLLDSGQIRREIVDEKIRYFINFEIIELPVIRIQIVCNYVAKTEKRLRYPERFGEIRIFVYTKRPLKYGFRNERFEFFRNELENVERNLFFSLAIAVKMGSAERVIGFEDTEITQKMFEEEKGVIDKILGIARIVKRNKILVYRFEKNGEYKIIERTEI
ncbi:MAG: hypothetical protein QXW35_02750 [Candidatus Aenigmatarchaeota archaeon]